MELFETVRQNGIPFSNHASDLYIPVTEETRALIAAYQFRFGLFAGVYHHADKKHMGRYVNEFTFRLNQGNVSRHTTERLDSFVDAVAGKRLTFERLTQ